MSQRPIQNTVSDEELVKRTADGDTGAFEELYDRHRAQAFGLAMRITRERALAEEVTQDAFLALWRSAARYDPARASLKTWLLAVVRNRGIDLIRSAASRKQAIEFADEHADTIEDAVRTEELVIDAESSRHTRDLLSQLPAGQRQVIELSFFQGMSGAEIAAAIGVPLGTVKGRQRLALEKLHRVLAGSVSGTPALGAPDWFADPVAIAYASGRE